VPQESSELWVRMMRLAQLELIWLIQLELALVPELV
jgi:hypothetical protein